MKKGRPYYNLIKEDKLGEYIESDKNFTLSDEPLEEKKVIKTQTFVKNKSTSDVEKRSKDTIEFSKTKYNIKLMRESEKPIKI